jgi:hypothetical protein
MQPLACLAAPLFVVATHDAAATLLTVILAACQLAVEPLAQERQYTRHRCGSARVKASC